MGAAALVPYPLLAGQDSGLGDTARGLVAAGGQKGSELLGFEHVGYGLLLVGGLVVVGLTDIAAYILAQVAGLAGLPAKRPA